MPLKINKLSAWIKKKLEEWGFWASPCGKRCLCIPEEALRLILEQELSAPKCPNCGGQNVKCEEWDEGEPLFICKNCGCRFMD